MIFLLSAFLAMAIFDAYYTTRMLEKYGPVIEMNKLIKKLCEHLDIKIAVAIGVGLPTIGLSILGLYYHPILWAVTLLRVPLALKQLRHLATI